jgi:hypothetical protein
LAKFLFKANDSVLSFCRCIGEPAMSTGQLDCPWCGCGWLIACSKCLRPFTFAEVRETDVPIAELGWREAKARGLSSNVTEEKIAEWAEGMIEALDPFDIGDIVIYLDGSYWTVDSTNIEFTGYFAKHQLERLPHAEALADESRLRAILGDKNYWLEREDADRESL